MLCRRVLIAGIGRNAVEYREADCVAIDPSHRVVLLIAGARGSQERLREVDFKK